MFHILALRAVSVCDYLLNGPCATSALLGCTYSGVAGIRHLMPGLSAALPPSLPVSAVLGFVFAVGARVEGSDHAQPGLALCCSQTFACQTYQPGPFGGLAALTASSIYKQ